MKMLIVVVMLLLAAPWLMNSGSLLAQSPETTPARVFTDIEQGLNSGTISRLALYLAPQTYLSLSNGTTGYYSANQAFFILQEFFRVNKPESFRFMFVRAEKNPYGTGVLNFETRGRRGSAQVYIALSQHGGTWHITQLTIR